MEKFKRRNDVDPRIIALKALLRNGLECTDEDHLELFSYETVQVKSILEQARVPKSWYEILDSEDDSSAPEDTICIAPSPKGIVVFMRERGTLHTRKVFQNWQSAIHYIANQVELRYTWKIMTTAKRHADSFHEDFLA